MQQEHIYQPLLRVTSPGQRALEDRYSYREHDEEEIQSDHILIKRKEHIRLHRGLIFNELETYFIENTVNFDETRIEMEMVLPNGTVEEADDNGGVIRDALFEFWSDFYKKCTEGNSIKVPIISPNRNAEQWKAYAKILVLGYKQEGYLPVQLAVCFLRCAISGEDALDKQDDIVENYKQYLDSQEADVVSKALDDFDPDDQDDILDFLDEHNINRMPTKENIHEIIRDLAHKELIQAPAFISKCWATVLKSEMQELLEEDLQSMCEKLTPDPKKVLKTMKFPGAMNASQEVVSKFIKRYIRGCTDKNLKLFLRFCTGRPNLPLFKVAFKIL